MFNPNKPFHPFFVLFSLVLLFSLLALLLLKLIGSTQGVDYFDPSILENPTIQTISTQILTNHIFMFIIPGALTLFVFPALRPKGTLSFAYTTLEIFGQIFVLFLVSLPLVGFLTWLNLQIPLSDTLASMEDQVGNIIEVLLKGGNVVFLVFLMGFIPALGEELVFRGVIQKGLSNWTKSPHLAIISTGILFSLFHMQFAGFLPRMFLGIVLGYAYFFSKSLLVPMILHFLFNASQAVAMSMDPAMIDEMGDAAAEMPPWWVVLLTFIGFVLVFRRLLQLTSVRTA